MEVQYPGYKQTEIKVEIDDAAISALAEIVRESFYNHLEFGSYSAKDSSLYQILPDSLSARVVKFCETYGVDWLYPKERLAFFKAILETK
jgi:hypothetical protein